MSRAERRPQTTLFVGDSAIDAETARRAGVRLCLVDFGFGKLPASFTLRDRANARVTRSLGR